MSFPVSHAGSDLPEEPRKSMLTPDMVTQVRLVAQTIFDLESVDDMFGWGEEHIDPPNSSDMLAEFAGRLCYLSFDRPSKKTARNREYIANIIKQQHFSVLEHSSATFLLLNLSRTCTHELVRHRHLSYSQVSQRYVDESSSRIIIPDVLTQSQDPHADDLVRALHGHQSRSHSLYRSIYDYLRGNGASKKEARGAARSVLLGNTRTSILVSGNLRAWREFLVKRHNRAADPEIRGIATAIRAVLVDLAPATFQDIPLDPFGTKTEEPASPSVPSVHQEITPSPETERDDLEGADVRRVREELPGDH